MRKDELGGIQSNKECNMISPDVIIFAPQQLRPDQVRGMN